MGLKMHFLESTALYYKKPVIKVMSGCTSEPFTCEYSDFAEFTGNSTVTKRWIDCSLHNGECKQGYMDWWQEYQHINRKAGLSNV
jgi:hypothetical protein